MAAITWFLTNNIADSVHQQLDEISPGSNQTSSPNYGWTVGTTGAGNYSSADAGSEVTGFSGTIQPDGSIVTTTNQGDCWRTKQRYTGRFATGNWTFQMSVIAVTAGGSADGNAGFRLFKGKAADGSDAVQITAGRLEGGGVTNLATSAQQDSVHNTTSITGFSVDGEYLFVQVGWEITGAALMSHDVIHRIGDTASQLISTDFTDTTTSTTNTADSGASGGGAGPAWTTPGNTAASDDAHAECITTALDEQSEDLVLTDFDFGDVIPVGSIINGVKAVIERGANVSNSVGDHTIQLLIAGTGTGENKAVLATGWPTTDAQATYGDEHDWWGLASLARADVVASNFGIRIRVINLDGSTVTARVDHVTLTVYFTPPGMATLAAVASLSSTGSLIHSGAATLPGVASLSPTGSLIHSALATLAAEGMLGPSGSLLLQGASTLNSVASIVANGSLIHSAIAELQAIGLISADGTVTGGGGTTHDGQALLGAVATIVALGSLVETYSRQPPVEGGFSRLPAPPGQTSRESAPSTTYSRQSVGSGSFSKLQPAQPNYDRESV